MTKSKDVKAVKRYYERIGTKLGYNLVMNRSQHFGYYDKNHTTERSAQVKFHEQLAKKMHLKPGMNVLDAGCGQGVVATYLAKHHEIIVTGITIVPHEIKQAKKLAEKINVEDKTHFLLRDYSDTGFEPSSFDRIYTTETLSHATDLSKTLNEFMRLLKPGGLIVCAEYEIDYNNLTEEENQVFNFGEKHGALHGLREFDKGNFAKLLKRSGYIKIDELDWTKPLTPSFKRLYDIAKPVNSVVKTLRLDKHFINTVAAKGYYMATKSGHFKFKLYSAKKA